MKPWFFRAGTESAESSQRVVERSLFSPLRKLSVLCASTVLWLLNEDWKVDKRLASQYVWATLITHERQLKIYHCRSADDPVRLIKTFHYKIPETVTPLLPEFKRAHRRRNMFTML